MSLPLARMDQTCPRCWSHQIHVKERVFSRQFSLWRIFGAAKNEMFYGRSWACEPWTVYGDFGQTTYNGTMKWGLNFPWAAWAHWNSGKVLDWFRISPEFCPHPFCSEGRNQYFQQYLHHQNFHCSFHLYLIMSARDINVAKDQWILSEGLELP